jgi:hypothetical protein
VTFTSILFTLGFSSPEVVLSLKPFTYSYPLITVLYPSFSLTPLLLLYLVFNFNKVPGHFASPFAANYQSSSFFIFFSNQSRKRIVFFIVFQLSLFLFHHHLFLFLLLNNTPISGLIQLPNAFF